MGFWDTLKEIGEGLGKVVVEGMASHGHIEQVINELKESPQSRWPHIIDGAYEWAENNVEGLQGWSNMFSNRLSEMEKEDGRFRGIHLLCLGVIAKRGLQKARS